MRSIFFNACVYTGTDVFSQAFLVENGIFTATGTNEEILAQGGQDAVLTDLEGRFVCPGFNDSHMHLIGLGCSLAAASLSQHTDSLAGLLSYLQRYAAENPPGEGRWLQGRGWNQDYFTDTDRMPDRTDLDTISTDYPIVITRACGHCCVVNSRALEIAGITGKTNSPAGGRIGMRCGEPDGRLYDNAIDLVEPLIPAPGKEELKDMIRRACRTLNACGVTSVQTDDYSAFRSVPFETVNAAYREMTESGELTVRVYEQANFTVLPELRRFVEQGNVTGKGNDFFRIGPLKMLGDGSLGSRTAYLSAPYADGTGTRGFPLFDAGQMREMIHFAHTHGMQVAVHAIGDACLDQVLGAIRSALEECPRDNHRHGIIHCQITRPEQLSEIIRMKLHVYIQSIFLDYDNHIVESRVGPERAGTSYRWKTLMENGASVSNGSDSPVEPPDVMRGIECAVTRTSMDGTGPYLPEEAFTVREALDSFTVRGAEASFEDEKKGRIASGLMADFTVLERNPFEEHPGNIHAIPVHSTWIGGKCVYGKKAVSCREPAE